MSHTKKSLMRCLVPVILFLILCSLAYDAINLLIQTFYIVIIVALGLDDGKMIYYDPYNNSKRLILPFNGTWHVMFAQPLTWISTIANVYFWWMRFPDFLDSPMPQAKTSVAIMILSAPFWVPIYLMGIGRIFKAFAQDKMLSDN